jgi:hypothetical protein
LAERIDSLEDVESFMPGYMNSLKDWFLTYKMTAGKEVNKLISNGKLFDAKFAMDSILEDHDNWLNMVKNGHNQICTENTSLNGSRAKKLTRDQAEKIVNSTKELVPQPAHIERTHIDQFRFIFN